MIQKHVVIHSLLDFAFHVFILLFVIGDFCLFFVSPMHVWLHSGIVIKPRFCNNLRPSLRYSMLHVSFRFVAFETYLKLFYKNKNLFMKMIFSVNQSINIKYAIQCQFSYFLIDHAMDTHRKSGSSMFHNVNWFGSTDIINGLVVWNVCVLVLEAKLNCLKREGSSFNRSKNRFMGSSMY